MKLIYSFLDVLQYDFLIYKNAFATSRVRFPYQLLWVVIILWIRKCKVYFRV